MFSYSDHTKSIECIVEDYERGMPTNKFMGKILIPLRPFMDKKPIRNWYEMLNKVGQNDGKRRGKVKENEHEKLEYIFLLK